MNIFFTADLHLSHKNICKFAKRPFNNVDHMNECLVQNWNADIKQGDLVYILGDFAWRDHGHWLHRLNGKKVLIRGNHDKMSGHALSLFSEVYDLRTISINKQKIVLCHYKLSTWAGKYRKEWHFYGHSHGRIAERDDVHSCDVGIDAWDYRPVPYEVLQAKMNSRVYPEFDPSSKDAAYEIQQLLMKENLEFRSLK